MARFPSDLSEAALGERDEAVLARKTKPESHGEQPLHGGHDERCVCGITIPLPLHPPLLVVKLSIDKPWRRLTLRLKQPIGFDF